MYCYSSYYFCSSSTSFKSLRVIVELNLYVCQDKTLAFHLQPIHSQLVVRIESDTSLFIYFKITLLHPHSSSISIHPILHSLLSSHPSLLSSIPSFTPFFHPFIHPPLSRKSSFHRHLQLLFHHSSLRGIRLIILIHDQSKNKFLG